MEISSTPAPSSCPESLCDRLDAALDHAAHYLPTQGPISVFVHHNTLHAFENLPFHEAIKLGHRYFGGEPYPSEAELRAARAASRITPEDLDAVLEHELEARGAHAVFAGGLLTRRTLLRLMLDYPIADVDEQSIRWHLVERDLGRTFRSDVPAVARDRIIAVTRAWLRDRIAREGVAPVHAVLRCTPQWGELLTVPRTAPQLHAHLEANPEAYALVSLWNAALQVAHDTSSLAERTGVPAGLMKTHRDIVLERTGQDTRHLVSPVLTRWTAAYLDQGLAYWPMPAKERGLLGAVRALYSSRSWVWPGWMAQVSALFREQEVLGRNGTQVVVQALADLGVAEADWEPFITATLLTMPGWAGLIRQLELDPNLAPHDCPPVSLKDFLALRLTLEIQAIASISRTAAPPLSPPNRLLGDAGEGARSPGRDASRANRYFQVFQLAGVAAPELLALSREDRLTLAAEIDHVGDLDVRRLMLLAYERNYRQNVLGAIAQKLRRTSVAVPPSTPRFQFAFCIDEREESIRRHIEEVCPESETIGIAGFFGVAVAYQGLYDPHPVPLCPMGVEPKHLVREIPDPRDRSVHESRRKLLRLLYLLSFGLFVGTRTFVRGWLATLFLGAFAMLPLTARVFLPRWVANLRHRLSRWLLPNPRTDLTLERTEPAVQEHGRWVGFTIGEMTDGVERTMRAAGLTRFAPLVFVLGHGSTSLNNPHESAHDCGACGGRRGAPNARMLARFANHPEVRAGLASRGIEIPPDTWFVGGCHDTCTDAIDLLDLDRLPPEALSNLPGAQAVLDEARMRNADERCRRFESAGAVTNPREALAHVESRSEDLSEVRPEYGHATNACAIIGPRALSRSLFLDRRAFLVSYDAPTDGDGEILLRLLTALVPVASGISLEYYFSRIDSSVYGCGSKLPHNITGLVGVVNGHGGDILTGLPWQMVEVHEPMRLLTVLEADPHEVLRVVNRIPSVRDCIVNEWVHVACVDPRSGEITVLERGVFVPFVPSSGVLPTVPCSRSWYRGRRDFVSPAYIQMAPVSSSGAGVIS